MSTPANPPVPNSDPPILQIYNQINGLFGHKAGQMFMMEFPGRIIDMGTYSYADSATINAQQTKPQAVAEAEFRLSDDLYTLAQLTGGPKGATVSNMYNQILGGLIPASSKDATFAKEILPDQLLISNWLLELVSDWTPPGDDILADLPSNIQQHVPPKKPPHPPHPDNEVNKVLGKIPRIDLYQKLLDAYENERFRWEQFKLQARPTDDKDVKAWDLYNRTMSLFAPAIDKKLEALWTTLLVRGQYHRVRHLIGLVDVESSAEALLRAKENMRASVMRSLDDTEDVYPVQFSPASWANYLTTDFEPVDLLMSPDLLRTRMLEKQEQRRSLLSRLSDLKGAAQDISALQQKADEAQAAYTTAQNDMMQGFSDATLSLVQMYFKSQGAKDTAEVQAVEKGGLDGVLKANHQPPISDEQFTQLKNMQANCIKNQSNYLTAAENVTRSQAALVGGIAADPKMAISTTQDQIDSLTASIETLRQILDAATTNVTGFDRATNTAKEADPVAIPAKNPDPPTPKTGASEWSAVTVTYEHSASTKSSAATSSATQTSWSVSLWIGSASGSSSSSSATSKEQMTTDNTNIQVGFNVMKVEIARPWLDASILDSTQDYFRTFSKPISRGTAFLDQLNKSGATQTEKDAALTAANDALLPAYPIAFIIAKDVTLTMSHSFANSGSAKSYAESSMATGGGILCFSCSSSSHSSTSDQSAYSEADSTVRVAHQPDNVRLMRDVQNITIRIPGPQILGWIIQTVQNDDSSVKYGPIDRSQFTLGDPNGTVVAPKN